MVNYLYSVRRNNAHGALHEQRTDIQSLDAEIIRELVEKIVVHQAEKTENGRVQRITIYYNGIGPIALPQPQDP